MNLKSNKASNNFFEFLVNLHPITNKSKTSDAIENNQPSGSA